MDLPPPAAITDRVRAFLEAPRFATLATSGEDAAPHQAVIWFRLDPDDRVLVNSRTPRRWPADLRRDGRGSLAVMDEADGNRWVGLTLAVETIVDDVERARDDIVALAVRYDDASEASVAEFRRQPRISFRLRVVAIHDHLE
jgi:pyridoxamine 5'-phosphate oxidase-like protein